MIRKKTEFVRIVFFNLPLTLLLVVSKILLFCCLKASCLSAAREFLIPTQNEKLAGRVTLNYDFFYEASRDEVTDYHWYFCMEN